VSVLYTSKGRRVGRDIDIALVDRRRRGVVEKSHFDVRY